MCWVWSSGLWSFYPSARTGDPQVVRQALKKSKKETPEWNKKSLGKSFEPSRVNGHHSGICWIFWSRGTNETQRRIGSRVRNFCYTSNWSYVYSQEHYYQNLGGRIFCKLTSELLIIERKKCESSLNQVNLTIKRRISVSLIWSTPFFIYSEFNPNVIEFSFGHGRRIIYTLQDVERGVC